MEKRRWNVREAAGLAMAATILLSTLAAAISIVYANPIPVPTLMLQREDISISLERINNSAAKASVRGLYPFSNVGYKKVDMFFPVPREAAYAERMKVSIDGRLLAWKIVESGYVIHGGQKTEFTYETIDGIYPLLKWSIEDVPENFEIVVEYSYTISAKEDEFRTLYAMATGRFADTYAKQCTAYVNIELVDFQDYNASISLVPPPSAGIGSSRFQFTVDSDRERFNVIEESSMFNGLSRDLYITLKSKAEQAWEWRPYLPNNLKLWAEADGDGIINLTANILFNNGGYKVDWGEAYHQPDSKLIIVDANIMEWTGPSPQVIMNMTHNYAVGPLKPGDYVINYRVNNVTLKTLTLTVAEKPEAKQEDLTEPTLYILLGLPVAIAIILAAKKISPPT